MTAKSPRIHELPEFHFYAIAEGIRMLLSRCGRWLGFGKDDIDDKPDLFTFSRATNDSDNDTPERKILPPREIRPYFQKQLSHLLKPTKAHFALYLQGCRLFVVRKNGGCPGRQGACVTGQ